MPPNEWFLYLIRCSGGQLYTGITINVERRFDEHKEGKGAKFLRGKGPLKLVFQQQIGDQSSALKMEILVKKMSKASKEALVIKGTL